jgi:ATP-dependent Lon protease
VRNYLDWKVGIPLGQSDQDAKNIKEAQKISMSIITGLRKSGTHS